MATTTNYGWETPDDTDLVKDGAAAIRTLGSSIDTTTKNLNPETTLGDIAYRSSTANTNTRLAIGTTGQVLTVSGGVPTWAAPAGVGNLAQIATGTLSGASVTISGLSSYSDIFVHCYSMTNSTADGIHTLRVNNNSGANYQQNQIWTVNDAGGVAQINNPTGNTAWNFQNVNADRGAPVSAYFATLTNCKEAGFTAIESQGYVYTGAYNVLNVSRGIYKVSEAVSSIVLANTGGNWAGGTYVVWGA